MLIGGIESWRIRLWEHQIMLLLRFRARLGIPKLLTGGQWESFSMKCWSDIHRLPLRSLVKLGIKFKIGGSTW